MEPRRPKHKQLPPLEVSHAELEAALRLPETYISEANLFSSRDRARHEEGCHGDLTTAMPGEPITVLQTHLSMVFLLPQRVYKLKKCVNFGFVDFSTLYKRFQACFAEVQLNRRLAPHVYVGVVPVAMHRATRRITVRCDAFWTPERNDDLDYWMNDAYGEIVEWAVHMERLPDECTLLHLLQEDALTKKLLRDVAARLAAFHKDARRGPKIDAFGKEEVVRGNIDENFAQTKDHVEETVATSVYNRVRMLTYQRLNELSDVIAGRVEHGYTCDSHGDLRLEHIYVLDRPAESNHNHDPAVVTAKQLLRQMHEEEDATLKGKDKELVVLDCIEFNEQFRFGDPIADAAFLAMDLWRMGHPELARFFEQEYLLHAEQDSRENKKLFAFYAAYRAVVRAKVSGFRVMDTTLDDAHREQERQRARCYWLVALSLLSDPCKRPCLLMVAGLPASGKSTLARMLAGDGSAVTWLRADAIRKELMAEQKLLQDQEKHQHALHIDDKGGESQAQEAAGSFEEGLYSPAMTERTYDELLIRSVMLLRQGKRVVVDATFRDPLHRQHFITTARDEGALFAFLVCSCDREIVRGRLLARKNDISDATWDVYEKMEAEWHVEEELRELPECTVVNTEKEQELTLRRANVFLRQMELL